MYHVDKLCFKNHIDEMMNLRIVEKSIFLYPPKDSGERPVGVWVTPRNPERQKYYFYEYCKDMNTLSLRHSTPYRRRAGEFLENMALVEKRHYYLNTNTSTMLFRPDVINRKYSWSLTAGDFILTKLDGQYPTRKSRYRILQGREIAYYLIKAVHLYYNRWMMPARFGTYLKDGKYYTSRGRVYYNATQIGTMRNNKVTVFDNYKSFRRDFDE